MTPEEIRAIPDPAERFRAVNAKLNPDRELQREFAAIARESVRELRAQKLSWRQIGAQLGISGPRAQQLGSDPNGGHSHGDPNPCDPDCTLCQAQKNGGQK